MRRITSGGTTKSTIMRYTTAAVVRRAATNRGIRMISQIPTSNSKTSKPAAKEIASPRISTPATTPSRTKLRRRAAKACRRTGPRLMPLRGQRPDVVGKEPHRVRHARKPRQDEQRRRDNGSPPSIRAAISSAARHPHKPVQCPCADHPSGRHLDTPPPRAGGSCHAFYSLACCQATRIFSYM